jgi:hypothetical protein
MKHTLLQSSGAPTMGLKSSTSGKDLPLHYTLAAKTFHMPDILFA